MKTKTTNILFGIVFVGLVFDASAFAAPLNLSVFKGKYKGTATVTSTNFTEIAPATVSFAVPASGATGRVNYTVTLADTQISSFAFAANKRVTVTDILVGIAGANNAKAGEGPWRQTKRTLKFSADNGEGTSLRGTATVRDLRNRRQLTLTLVTSDGVESTTFATKLRAPL